MDSSLETDPSLSTPSDTSPPSDSPPTDSSPTTPDASPPVAETPPELPPPSPPPSVPPPSSPDPSSPPPVEKSPPSSPPPSPPSDSQPPPDESSPPSTPVPSFSSPPSNNDSPSPPAQATPTTPVTNPSQPSPFFSSPSPPHSNNSPFQPAPNGRVSPSLPNSPSPPRHSQGSSRPTSSSSSPLSNPNSRDGTVLIVVVVVGGVLILALLVVCLLWNKRKKKQPYYSDPGHPPMGGDQYWNARKPNDHVVKLPPPQGASWGTQPSSDFGQYSGQNRPGLGPPSPSPNVGGGMMGGYNQSQFTYEELAAATGGFAESNLLGQGGFGYVHKGVLSNDRQVAVKSLKAGSGQGEREFQAEVEIISRVHHRHLVSLVGYCISDKQRMLVYEFVSNSTLEFHLHGKGQPVMDWPTRMRIALGSAKGLAYLHEDCNPRIIHRDIKSANILLDDNYEAMVADFGLAKLTTDNSTHVSTRVMGTFGYLAPEYASSGKLTEKSDVFSFGIMLLELITGRRPVDPTNKTMEDGLVDWARQLIPKALEEDEFSDLVDPRLEANYDHHEMARMIACASACIRHSARRRPKMSQIIRALDGNSSLDDLNDVPKRSPSTISNTGNVTMTYDTGMYNADMMKFRKMVLPSQEFASEDGGGTSEYGLNPSASSSDEFGSKQQQQMKKPY